MRKALLAAVLAAGMAVANAVSFIAPGDSSFLGTELGSGSAFVAWDGTTTFGALFDFSGTEFGYLVEDATDTVVVGTGQFINAAPVHFATSFGPTPPQFYYLATSAFELYLGDSIAGVTAYESERFRLGVPEPGSYAMLAGLGLVGFAGYRRFRG